MAMALAKLNIPIPSSGLVVDRPAEFVDSRSIVNCQNIEIYRNLVRQRQGSELIGSSLGERIMGLAELESGINTYFVRVGLTKFEVVNKTTEAWTSAANTALTGNAENPVSFAFPLISAVKYLVYTNNVDAIRKYSGTGNDANLGGSPPKCKYVLDFKTYLLLANVTDSGTNYFARVQWSDTAAPETWTGGNSGSTNLLEDSLPITGISRFGDFVTVHKESAIYLGQLVDTSEVFRFTRKETGAGAIANGSIQNLPDGTQIFLARDGLRLFNGVTSTLIPSPIIEELRDSMNPQWVHRATSVLVKDLDEYWVGIPIGSQEEPETIYKYNYRTGQVYKDTRTGLMSLALFRRTSDETYDEQTLSYDEIQRTYDSIIDLALHRAVSFGDESGNVYLRSSATNDESTAIDSIWDTKDFTINDVEEAPEIGKVIRWLGLDIYALGNSVTLYYSTDSGFTWNLVGSKTLASDYPGDDDPDIFYFDVVSSKIRFRLRNATASSAWTMKQYVLSYSVRESRK